MSTAPQHLERMSIELTNRCFKACSFCYNSSSPESLLRWEFDDLLAFVHDCAKNGIKAVSFGGGEPLQYEGIFDLFAKLKGKIFRSMTTNGLLLDQFMDDLVAVAPDKVHVSVHFPDDRSEVDRVIEQVGELADLGIRSGVNFLIAKSRIEASKEAAARIRAAGIDNSRIVYLPMRISDTPTPHEVATVAGSQAFQSMSCLSNCTASPRFCSISATQDVGWCSYTKSRNRLRGLTYADLMTALTNLDLLFCGGSDGN